MFIEKTPARMRNYVGYGVDFEFDFASGREHILQPSLDTVGGGRNFTIRMSL